MELKLMVIIFEMDDSNGMFYRTHYIFFWTLLFIKYWKLWIDVIEM